jgi:hypothetical protein
MYTRSAVLATPYLCGAWKVPVWPSMVSGLRDSGNVSGGQGGGLVCVLLRRKLLGQSRFIRSSLIEDLTKELVWPWGSLRWGRGGVETRSTRSGSGISIYLLMHSHSFLLLSNSIAASRLLISLCFLVQLSRVSSQIIAYLLQGGK